ncbi:DUF255 domain-containing protein [Agrobacterium rubi]|nr:DUF255 domain-containing protein [Agrobacterium rubi]NTF24766.1 DUF255 domain-containing protein [Agrobacterium rubi]
MLKFLAVIMFVLAATQPSGAAEGVRVSVISGGYGQSGDQVLNGLKVELDAGWHAYWKSPGETGLAPDLQISGTNLHGSKVYWPLPERFTSSGFETVGYRSSFVVPVISRVSDSSRVSDLAIKGTIYACSDICVPVAVDAKMQISPGDRNVARLSEIALWLARAPGGARSNVTHHSTVRDANGDIEVQFSSSVAMRAPSAYIDFGMQAFASLKSIALSDGGSAVARFAVNRLRDAPPDMTSGRIVLSDGVSSPIEVPLEITDGGLLAILVVALVGGLILNAMPCVFPVLAIKLLMISSIERSRIRASLFMMAVGIVTTFVLIGASLAAIKAAGHTVGWGIQFQQPLFLFTMAFILILFGTSLTGAFNIILPSSLATKLTSATAGDGAWKSLLQGMVLTLLATPCSAPFVGTAVGYGLSGSVSDILPVFSAMGLGMASPFLVIGAFPGLARLLPRPGRWMEHVKHATAAAMFGTAGWLIYLLHAVDDTPLLLAAAASVLAGIGFAWTTSRRGAAAMALAAALAPAVFLLPELAPAQSSIGWRKFEPAAIEELVNQGQTVFVDITADWCLTCKVNDRGALASDDVVSILRNATVPMKGDWTRPDETISSFLSAHGRYGIPFYLVVGPRAPQGLILPELLTPDIIKEAIDKASARKEASESRGTQTLTKDSLCRNNVNNYKIEDLQALAHPVEIVITRCLALKEQHEALGS